MVSEPNYNKLFQFELFQIISFVFNNTFPSQNIMDDDSDHVGSNSHNITLKLDAHFLLNVTTAVINRVGTRYKVEECLNSSLFGKQYVEELFSPATNAR